VRSRPWKRSGARKNSVGLSVPQTGQASGSPASASINVGVGNHADKALPPPSEHLARFRSRSSCRRFGPGRAAETPPQQPRNRLA
jgi:hypothetical protein